MKPGFLLFSLVLRLADDEAQDDNDGKQRGGQKTDAAQVAGNMAVFLGVIYRDGSPARDAAGRHATPGR